MKRSVAFLLAVIMVIGIIPVSLLPALAHGIGVGANDIQNLSINNAPNQSIPATVEIDGKSDDTGWASDEWNEVDAGSGIWNTTFSKNYNFGYKYQLHIDYDYLYGVVVVDTSEIHNGDLGNITVWVNDGSNAESYTAKVVLSKDSTSGEWVMNRYRFANGTVNKVTDADSKTTILPIEAALIKAVTDGDVLTVEFRTRISVLTDKTDYNLSSYTSVEIVDSNGNSEYLYHPRNDAAVDATTIDPATAWPENAQVISKKEIYATDDADYSQIMPTPITVDGKFYENTWSHLSDYHTDDYSWYEYNKDDNKAYQVNNLDMNYSHSHNRYLGDGDKRDGYNFDKVVTGDTGGNSMMAMKYDIDSDGKYIYGAASVLADTCDSTLYDLASLYDEKTNKAKVNTYFDIMFWVEESSDFSSPKAEKMWQHITLTHSMEVTRQETGDEGSGNYKYLYGTGNAQTSVVTDIGDFTDSSYAKASRSSRYLINLEFRIPYDDLGAAAGDNVSVIIQVSNKGTRDYNVKTENAVYCRSAGHHGVIYGQDNGSFATDFMGDYKGVLNGGKYYVSYYTLNDKGDVTKNAPEPNGSLEPSVWPGLAAADQYINGSKRKATETVPTTTKGDVESYLYDVFIDNEYIYGAAIMKNGQEWQDDDCFRIWINNDRGRWHDVYDYVVTFRYNGNVRIDSQGTASQFKDGTTGGNWTGGETYKVAYSNDDAAKEGIEFVMRTVESGEYSGTDATNVAVLEFKIPLEVVGVTEVRAGGEYALGYYVSVETSFGSEGLFNPMPNNLANLTERGVADKAAYSSDFDAKLWAVAEAKKFWTDQRNDYIVIDSKGQEEFWNNADERIHVDSTNASWSSLPDVEDMFEYDFRVYTGREYLYGMAEIYAPAEGTTFTLWINDSPDTSTKATDKFEISLDGENVKCIGLDGEDVVFTKEETRWQNNYWKNADGKYINADGVVVDEDQRQLEAYTATLEYGWVVMTTINDTTYVEFMFSLEKCGIVNHEAVAEGAEATKKYDADTFYLTEKTGFEYLVSVTHNHNTLYYPNVTVQKRSLWITDINEKVATGADGYNRGYIVTDVDDYPAAGAYGGYCAIFQPTDYCDVYQVAYKYYTGGLVTNDEEAHRTAAINALQEPGSFAYFISEKTGAYNRQVYEQFTATDANVISQGKYIRIVGLHLHDVANMTSADIPTDCGNNMTSDIVGWYTDVQYFVMSDRWNVFRGYTDDDKYAHLAEDIELGQFDRWDASNALVIPALGYYAPEEITIDGYLDDSGWADDKWIEVSNDSNGNLQNATWPTATEVDYKYQMRYDGEYIYVAALLNIGPEPVRFPYAMDGKDFYSIPGFRIWIKSGDDDKVITTNDGSGDTKTFAEDAVSFTHLFDVQSVGGTVHVDADYDNGINESAVSITKYTYTPENYVTWEPDDVEHVGADNNITIDWATGDTGTMTYGTTAMRFAEHTYGFYNPNGGNANEHGDTNIDKYDYDASVFYGYTEVIEENTGDGYGTDYVSSNWYAKPQIEKYTYGNEHAVCNSTDDGSQTVFEFRFSLEDIGCEDGDNFEYFVQGYTSGKTASQNYVLFNPPVVKSFSHRTTGNASSNLPYWLWSDTAQLVDEDFLEKIKLRNPCEPVSPLGVQYDADYNGSKALRFGVLYKEQYLDLPKEGDAQYDNATYWDAKEIGMIYRLTRLLTLNENTNETQLYTDTKNVTYIESDAILNWQTGSCMADYENYIFYAILKIPDNQVDTKITYRGFVEYYPEAQIYYDMGQWIFDGSESIYGADENGDTAGTFRSELLDSKTKNIFDVSTALAQKTDYVWRPTYYSPAVNRNYNLVKTASDGGWDIANESALPDQRPEEEAPDHNGLRVVYVPLDDRPVNDERVRYLAEATGIELIMPPEELYSTRLNNDDDTSTDCSKQGDPMKLLEWLEGIKEEYPDVRHYILSLDQLFSGGLVGARAPFEVENTNYTSKLTTIAGTYNDDGRYLGNGEVGTISPAEQEIVEYLDNLVNSEKSKNMGVKVYFIDTIMRLASTNLYQDFDINDYNALRNYSMVEREQFYGSELNIENIVTHYGENADGEVIASPAYVTVDQYNRYMAARERKLLLADALYSKVASNVEALYIAVDDSNPKITIQTNETRYVTEKLINGCDQCDLFAGTDELGLTAFSSLITDLYGTVSVNLEYFGVGKDALADSYDNGGLHTSVRAHIVASGGTFDYNEDAEMDILVLSRCDDWADMSYTEAEKTGILQTEAAKLAARAKANEKAGIPTCIIDASNQDFDNGLYEALEKADVNMAALMGYSEWGTVSNAVGISLGEAIARYSYLANVKRDETTADDIAASHAGFYKLRTFGLVKEIAYILYGNKPYPTESSFNEYYNLYLDKAEMLCNKINAWDIVTGIDEYGKVIKENLYDVAVWGTYWMWNRNYEAGFTVQLYENGTAITTGNEKISNIAANGSYTVSGYWRETNSSYDPSADPKYGDSGNEMVDGLLCGETFNIGTTGYGDAAWIGLHTSTDEYKENGFADVTFTLDKVYNISNVAVTIGTDNMKNGINTPQTIRLSVSTDGTNWTQVDVKHPTTPASYKDSSGTEIFPRYDTVGLGCETAQEAKYVRIEFHDSRSTFFFLSEIEIYAKEENLALGAEYEAPAAVPNYNAKLTDGITYDSIAYTGDHWYAMVRNNNISGTEGTITVDLGVKSILDSTRIHFEEEYASGIRMPSTVEVYVSDDNINFEHVTDFTPKNPDGYTSTLWQGIELNDAEGRYVKFVFNTSDTFTVFDEIEIYGTSIYE